MAKMSAGHAKALYALVLIALVAVGVSVSRGSVLGVAMSLGLGIVLVFVMSIAWARFRGEPPEHHPRSDGILDDTDP